MAIAQKNSFDNLKLLTNWLISTKEPNIDSILTDSNPNQYKYRLITYLLKYPKLVSYLNNYLNDIYLFDSPKYKLEEWLYTFRLIFKNNNFKSLDRIYFSKFKPAKRTSFKNEIKEFELNVNDRVLSEDDLNELYRLHTLKIISDENFEEIKLLNLGKDNKTSKLPFAFDVPTQKENVSKIITPISNFNNNLIGYIKNRVSCKNCALYSSPKYPVISNIKDEKDSIDVIVVGDFPSNENFIDDHRYIKLLLEKYNLNYLATNLVLCQPNNGEIPNTSKTISNCKEVTYHVYKNFKSNFKILVGTNAKKFFNIKAPMTKVNGELINDCFILASSNYVSQHKSGLTKLNSYLEKYSKEKISRLNIETSSINSTNINFNYDLKNYTLFDIKIINEQILYILIENKTGNKKYITENISYPVYIKTGNYRSCDHFSDNCDFVVYLSKIQKMNLSQQMKKQLNKEVLL